MSQKKVYKTCVFDKTLIFSLFSLWLKDFIWLKSSPLIFLRVLYSPEVPSGFTDQKSEVFSKYFMQLSMSNFSTWVKKDLPRLDISFSISCLSEAVKIEVACSVVAGFDLSLLVQTTKNREVAKVRIVSENFVMAVILFVAYSFRFSAFPVLNCQWMLIWVLVCQHYCHRMNINNSRQLHRLL